MFCLQYEKISEKYIIGMGILSVSGLSLSHDEKKYHYRKIWSYDYRYHWLCLSQVIWIIVIAFFPIPITIHTPGHGRVSLTRVSFLQFLTYRLLPRLKRSARGWTRTLCTQITIFTCFLNVGNPQKVRNKNIDFWKLHFFKLWNGGGQKVKIL